MAVEKTWTVTTRGVGRVDYSQEIAAGEERPGVLLKYNQQFRVFAASMTEAEVLYPYVLDNPIEVGDERHLRDSDTFETLPITLPAGYTLSMIEIAILTTQDTIVYGYIDSISGAVIGIAGAYLTMHEARLRGQLNTTWYDATAALPHDIDLIARNKGDADMYGSITILCIQEAVGTPPWPTTKDCHCPYCEYKTTVKVRETVIVCSNPDCKKLYIVTNFSSLRRLP